VASRADFVMASVHRFPDERGRVIEFADVDPATAAETEFRLGWAAIADSHLDILGHPMGMSYQRYRVQPPDDFMLRLIDRAADHGVAIEVNAGYHADPLRLFRMVQRVGGRITFGSNAHETLEIGRCIQQIQDEARAG